MAINTEGKKTQGFGGSAPPKVQTTQPSQGATEASALAAGVGNALSQQVSALGILAQQTDDQISDLARPIAQYFGTVADGTALVGRVAQLMAENSGGPVDLTNTVQVDAPQLPSAKPSTMADFFGAPKRISLPGS